MKLHELHDNPGAAKKKVRVGRGPGSGVGKTAGRGIKGQKSRSGVAIKGYEGGQMPLYMRLPKRGFNKPDRRVFAEVNLGRIQKAIDAKRLDHAAPITEEALRKAGLVRHLHDGVRLLGKGTLSSKCNFEVTGASGPAASAIEKAGGALKILPPKSTPQLPPKERKRAPKKAKG